MNIVLSMLRRPAGFLMLALMLCWACDRSPAAVSGEIIKEGPRATRSGAIKDRRLNEISGIVASRRHEGIFWTHDDGTDGLLVAIKRDGTVVGAIEIDAKVRDWEDIAMDDAGNLFIADTGNNSENRKHVVVYSVREPNPADLVLRNSRAKLAVDQMWKVDFPDEPADVESLFVWRGIGYMIFKLDEGKPAEVYRYDLKETKKPTMEKVCGLPAVTKPVTSADLSVDGKQMAVLARGELWLFDVDGDVARGATAEATHIAMTPLQTEGCAFGKDEILIVAETGEVFAAPLEGRP